MPTLAHKAYLDSFPEEWERICPGGSVAYERQVHRDALTPEEETDLVLTVARTELADELRGYVDARWQRVVSIFENWWNKYRTTMQDIEGRCEETTEKLDHYLEVMGYA